MKSRTVWITLALLAALSAAAISVVLVNLDAYIDSQRPWLEQTASRLLARKVTAERIESKIWGGLGIRVEDIRIDDDPDFSSEPFLVAESLEVHLGVLAALRGELEIRSVTLVEPVLRLYQTAKGWNFDSFGENSDEPSPDDEGSASDPVRISLLQVERGTLHYTDATHDPAYTIVGEQLVLEARDWKLGDPFELDAKAVLTGTHTHDTHVRIALDPQETGPHGLELDVKGIAMHSENLIRFAPIARVLPDRLSASGPLHLGLSAKGTTDALDLDGFIDVESVALDTELIHKLPGDPLKLTFVGDWSDTAVAVSHFDFVGLGTKVKGNGRMSRAEPAILEFDSQSEEVQLRAVGLHTQVDSASSGATENSAAARAETMKKLEASGRFTLADGASPVGHVALRSTSGLVRSLTYRNLSVDVDFGADSQRAKIQSTSGNIAGIALEALHVELVQQGELLILEEARARTLGGTLAARGRTHTSAAGRTHTNADGRTHTSAADERASHLAAELQGARIEALQAALSRQDERDIEGKLDVRLDLRGNGSDLDSLRPSLSGTVDIKIEDGILHGTNLAQGAVDTLLRIPGLKTALRREEDDDALAPLHASDTQFETIDVHANIEKGVAKTEKIYIIAPTYKIIGQGEVTLEGEVDANAILTFSEPFTGKLGLSGRLISGLLNPSGLLAIPVRLVGRLPDVETKADPIYIARALRDGLIMGTVDNILGGANRLFGRKQAAEPAEEPAEDPLQKILEEEDAEPASP